jgi:glycine/D-amino acid oxidase-like deaminating enzyme
VTLAPELAGRNNGSVGIIGAGIFGVTAALELSTLRVAVTLYEKRADILSGSTARNCFRLHRGYHYPRDPSTAQQARDGYVSFSRIFAEALVATTPHHYAIAAGQLPGVDAVVADIAHESGELAERVGLPLAVAGQAVPQGVGVRCPTVSGQGIQ